jgi:hypothetical protein
MSRFYTHPNRGFVVEADPVPAGLVQWLEHSGVATLASQTVDGIYVEPSIPLSRALAVMRDHGLKIENVRHAGATPSWHWSRSARTTRQRLGNPLSSTWLPTLPAA